MVEEETVAPLRWTYRLRGYLAAMVGGVLYFLGFAGFDLWPLCFIGLVPLIWVLETRAETPLRHRLALGATYGFVQQTGGFYWLVEMLGNFSGFGTAINIGLASLCWGAHGLVGVECIPLTAWVCDLGGPQPRGGA